MEKKTKAYKIPETMKAWVLENKNEVKLVEKSVPHPGPAEVLLHVDAVAICGTDLEILEGKRFMRRLWGSLYSGMLRCAYGVE